MKLEDRNRAKVVIKVILKNILLVLPILIVGFLWLNSYNNEKGIEGGISSIADEQVINDRAGEDIFIDAGEFDEFSDNRNSIKSNEVQKSSSSDQDCRSSCTSGGCPLSNEDQKNYSAAVLNKDSESADIQSTSGDEKSIEVFKASEDEFEEFDSKKAILKNGTESAAIDLSKDEIDTFAGIKLPAPDRLMTMMISFAGVISAGLLIRRSATRKARAFYMLAGLLFFGFYLGGCPCPIMGFFKIFLIFRGDFTALPGVMWFAGLAYLAYFTGKTWCGWLCPLGALQEFLYRPGIVKWAQKEGFNKSLRILRIMTVILLIGYLVVTGTILLAKIDPFKPVFNLFYGPVSTVTWILIALLAVTSIISFRPFCRAICPLGLIFGLISRIPGAVRIKIEENCKDCSRCEKRCDSGAINIKESRRKVVQEDCILCGTCMDNCNEIKISSLSKKKRKSYERDLDDIKAA